MSAVLDTDTSKVPTDRRGKKFSLRYRLSFTKVPAQPTLTSIADRCGEFPNYLPDQWRLEKIEQVLDKTLPSDLRRFEQFRLLNDIYARWGLLVLGIVLKLPNEDMVRVEKFLEANGNPDRFQLILGADGQSAPAL